LTELVSRFLLDFEAVIWDFLSRAKWLSCGGVEALMGKLKGFEKPCE
jgi:hypothetical protein